MLSECVIYQLNQKEKYFIWKSICRRLQWAALSRRRNKRNVEGEELIIISTNRQEQDMHSTCISLINTNISLPFISCLSIISLQIVGRHQQLAALRLHPPYGRTPTSNIFCYVACCWSSLTNVSQMETRSVRDYLLKWRGK